MRFPTARLAVTLLILAWTSVRAAPLPFAVPKDAPPPARPVLWSSAGEEPPCDTATTVAVTLDTDETLAGDTTGGESLVDAYACVGWQETGPEAVFLLDVQQDLSLHARLSSEVDLDLFLLTACDSDSCAAWDAGEFVVILPARAEPYVLVVDGYLGAEGPFDLDLRAYAWGPPPEACGEATPVACGEEALPVDGNLWERPNRLLADACATYLEWGGEEWYAVTLSDSATLTAEVSEHFFDAALWLFDGCDPGSACVDFADAAPTEGVEEISYRNLSGATHTYYLAVDAFHEIQSEGAGAYLLTFTCEGQIVAAERATLGGVKAMFR